MLESDKAEIMWSFQVQTDKQGQANQLDTVVTDKGQKIAGPKKKRECEKMKCQRLKGELEKMWKSGNKSGPSNDRSAHDTKWENGSIRFHKEQLRSLSRRVQCLKQVRH